MFKVGFLGGGQMAEAIIGGLFENSADMPMEYILYDPDRERRILFSQKYDVTIADSNEAVIKESSMVFIAVKPQVYPDVENILASHYREGQILVSIMAGLSLATIGRKIPKAKIVRLMPNTAMAVGAGVCLYSQNDYLEEKEKQWLFDLLSHIAMVVEIDESKMNAGSAISGSSPAFFYSMIEGLVLGGIEVGLPKKMALALAMQTMYGSAKMLKETAKDPTALRDAVLSPGGTTIEGIRVLEKAGLSSALIEAVAATTEKGEKMGKRKEESE